MQRERTCPYCGQGVRQQKPLDIVKVIVQPDEPINEWRRDVRKEPPGPYLIFAGKRWAAIGDADSIARKNR